MAVIDGFKRLVKRQWVLHRLARTQRRLIRRSNLDNGRLSASYWSCGTSGDGCLTIGGVDVRDLVREYGTPLHVVNFKRLRADHDAFLAAFRSRHERVILGTSYKTNPVPAVLQELHGLGTFAEVISDFELWLALKLGVPGARIIFNGPGKSLGAIERAVDHRVWTINADSVDEIRAVEQVCAGRSFTQSVGLRVTTSVGWQSQFGMNIGTGQARAAADLVKSQPHLKLTGLHLHLGNGIDDVGVFVEGVAETIEFAIGLEQGLGVELDYLDLGGGFAVPTVRKLDAWDLRAESLGYPARRPIPEEANGVEEFARAVFARARPLLVKLRRPVRLILEPGRAITSQSQVLLMSVIRVKTLGDGERAAILDGGRNMTMPLGWEYHEILPANRMADARLDRQSLFGPLCHPGDVVGLHRRMPPLEQGDVVAIMDAGAYFVPNQTNFSSPRPAIAGVRDGSASLLRGREQYEDMVKHDW